MKAPIFSAIYALKKPQIILITSDHGSLLADLVHFLAKKLFVAEKAWAFGGLGQSLAWLRNGKMIVDVSEFSPRDLMFLIENCSQCYFVLDWCMGPRAKAKTLEAWAALRSVRNPQSVKLIYNSDFAFGEDFSKIKGLQVCSFGQNGEPDLQISDIIAGDKTHFKASYSGKVWPVWMNGGSTAQEVGSVAACLCLADIFGLNLVEMTQEFKYYTEFDRFCSVDNS